MELVFNKKVEFSIQHGTAFRGERVGPYGSTMSAQEEATLYFIIAPSVRYDISGNSDKLYVLAMGLRFRGEPTISDYSIDVITTSQPPEGFLTSKMHAFIKGAAFNYRGDVDRKSYRKSYTSFRDIMRRETSPSIIAFAKETQSYLQAPKRSLHAKLVGSYPNYKVEYSTVPLTSWSYSKRDK